MYKLLKPVLDALFALPLLVVISPVFLLISIIIKLESEGPVFFTQLRIGKNGRQYRIYKFRTMRVDTPNVATDKLNDPAMYVTRFGRWLRKTSLDEIPQLLNILKGEMSFIGPRPALYNQYELIKARMDAGVYQVKPGITGFAQVKGRDYISDDEKVHYDRYYVEHLDAALDLKILAFTVIQILRAQDIKM